MRNTQEPVASKDGSAPVSPSLGIEARRALVVQAAVSAGDVWAKWWRAELERQGRQVAGGWPGTLSEARARVIEAVLPEVRKLGMREMTFEERELAAKTLYATARRRWLSRRKR